MTNHVVYYEDGGFAVYKIKLIGYASKFSAWYDAKGNLLDSARVDSRNRACEPSSDQKKALARIGARYVIPADK